MRSTRGADGSPKGPLQAEKGKDDGHENAEYERQPLHKDTLGPEHPDCRFVRPLSS
ncbi:MAG: hypothetical protein MZV70_04900 [Desulfobacterales bacterium]|nr:hypothetical protein [Desulfobacterales bacterium]